MDRNDFVLKARALVNLHGFSHVPIEIDRGKRRMGGTFIGKYTGEVRKFTFSSYYIDLNTWEVMENVVTHEIAHAMAGLAAGHSNKWKQIHLSLGGDGKRCSDTPDVVAPPARYRGNCNCPGKKYEVHRITEGRLNGLCRHCGHHFRWFDTKTNTHVKRKVVKSSSAWDEVFSIKF